MALVKSKYALWVHFLFTGIGRGRQLFFGFVLEHETHENGAAQRGEHEQDIAADKIKGIENAFAENGDVFPEVVAQYGGHVAENENAAHRQDK